jgi:hypothetical protein
MVGRGRRSPLADARGSVGTSAGFRGGAHELGSGATELDGVGDCGESEGEGLDRLIAGERGGDRAAEVGELENLLKSLGDGGKPGPVQQLEERKLEALGDLEEALLGVEECGEELVVAWGECGGAHAGNLESGRGRASGEARITTKRRTKPVTPGKDLTTETRRARRRGVIEKKTSMHEASKHRDPSGHPLG